MSILSTYKNQVELLLDVLPLIQKESCYALKGGTAINLFHRKIIETIQHSLLPSEKEFLLSIKSGEPDWQLMPIAHLAQLPGIQWKVINIKKMNKQLREAAIKKLEITLGY